MSRDLPLREEIITHLTQREPITSLFYGTTRAVIRNHIPTIITTQPNTITAEEQINMIRLLALEGILSEGVLFSTLFGRSYWNDKGLLLARIDTGLQTERLQNYQKYWQAGLAHLGFLWLWYIYQERSRHYPTWIVYYPNLNPKQRQCSLYTFTLQNELPKIKRFGLAHEAAFTALQQTAPDNLYQPWLWLLRWFYALNQNKEADLMEIFLKDLLEINAFPPPAKILCYFMQSTLAFIKGDVRRAQQIILEKIPVDANLPPKVLQQLYLILDHSRASSKATDSKSQKPRKKRVHWNPALVITVDDEKMTTDSKLTKSADTTQNSSSSTTPIISDQSAQASLTLLFKQLHFFCAFADPNKIAEMIEETPHLNPLPLFQKFEPEFTFSDFKEIKRWDIYKRDLPNVIDQFTRTESLIKQQIKIFSPLHPNRLELSLKISYEQLQHALNVKFSKKHIPALLRADTEELKAQQIELHKDLRLMNHVLPTMILAFNQARQLIQEQLRMFQNHQELTFVEHQFKQSLMDLENILFHQLLYEHIPKLLRCLGENHSIDEMDELAVNMEKSLLTSVLNWPIQMLELEVTRLKRLEGLALTPSPEEKDSKQETAALSTASLTSLSPRRTSIQLIQSTQQEIHVINENFLERKISSQAHQEQVTKKLKNLTHGQINQHQNSLTCFGLVVANFFIALIPSSYWLFRPLIKKNKGTAYPTSYQYFFSLKPKRVMIIEKIADLIKPIASP